MPFGVSRKKGGETADASALIGDYQTLHVKVKVSALTASQVSPTGYLKRNVPLTLSGIAPTLTNAVAQVETANVAGTITEPGSVSVTVTAAALPDNSKVILVPVADDDTAALVAGKIRAALAADLDVSGLFTVSGANAAIILTALSAGPNDASLNIALATGTATGLTAAPNSVNTTAGVAGSASEVPCITVEQTRVAASNSNPDLAAAQDVLVACAVTGTLNRDIMQDTIGRILTPAEIAALNGPNSKLVLSLT